MRNSKFIVFGLLVMFLSAGLTACSSGDDAVAKDDTVAEQPAAAQTKTVALYKYKFNPATLTVSAGTIVKFSNKDPDQHNVNIAALNIDQTLAAGESFEYKFDTAGEFAVDNRFATNPMKMTIIVE
ncbi:cupredoxin domain-containing protein [Bradymonas sediminis]|uniref:Uncharacterized protein n=1 Tax=Bradymonas sediminis TaxID=1548548 RepID=A0A2Z4FLI6_9DELT|nr:cupredoxin domain-containing protein [Bradymonas sediminis]AWV89811.1 hypothetical protein DN745_10860 [Bradymonas sediminis]TDP76442.1 plastocyanin [Bradymonas sediminis]